MSATGEIEREKLVKGIRANNRGIFCCQRRRGASKQRCGHIRRGEEEEGHFCCAPAKKELEIYILPKVPCKKRKDALTREGRSAAL